MNRFESMPNMSPITCSVNPPLAARRVDKVVWLFLFVLSVNSKKCLFSCVTLTGSGWSKRFLTRKSYLITQLQCTFDTGVITLCWEYLLYYFFVCWQLVKSKSKTKDLVLQLLCILCIFVSEESTNFTSLYVYMCWSKNYCELKVRN